jgi:hypothetical protein
VKSSDDGVVNIVFMDTEGFEGTGRADVYDDRFLLFMRNGGS